MANLSEIENYLRETLESDRITDYCPNGVQVRGSDTITRVVTGVSACQALFEAAVAVGAQLIVTHHGLFWNKDSRVVEGMLKARLKLLLEHDITLMGFHLPLDMHPELGNNAQILKRLQLDPGEPFGQYKGSALSRIGRWNDTLSVEQVKRRLEQVFGGEALFLESGPKRIHKVAVCSGGAPELIHEAVAAGADLFLTGEASEPVYHVAREMGIHFVAAGHHRTEMFGVQALGETLADKFDLEHSFIDIPNPI
ncbi:Nif3-like dinuclear metal center hexameric protein [Magnetococcus sp. PR-3]|uniref:Nif3-like dinuclear metal center hexameric protein n=1 Tax=Magnetococcus sp. PR-3 TaxID=3120355 RepID=UPI002FCDF9F1